MLAKKKKKICLIFKNSTPNYYMRFVKIYKMIEFKIFSFELKKYSYHIFVSYFESLRVYNNSAVIQIFKHPIRIHILI